MFEIEDILREEFEKWLDRAEEEFVQKLLHGDKSGEPVGVLDQALTDMVLTGNVYFDGATGLLLQHQEMMEHDVQNPGALSPLLLDRLSTPTTRALRKQEGLHWSEEAFRVQVLRNPLPMQMSPFKTQGSIRWSSGVDDRNDPSISDR